MGRDLEGLAEMFNKSEKFYCYDNHTFFSTQASMCGCTSIVVPDPEITKEKWMEGRKKEWHGCWERVWGNGELFSRRWNVSQAHIPVGSSAQSIEL